VFCQDYDCFYASVFEAEDPSLKHLPLAVQQKQIIVTCNYEARRQVYSHSSIFLFPLIMKRVYINCNSLLPQSKSVLM
jgi:nucleotidyltransferase/DNA polymerase involved in DNA repair